MLNSIRGLLLLLLVVDGVVEDGIEDVGMDDVVEALVLVTTIPGVVMGDGVRIWSAFLLATVPPIPPPTAAPMMIIIERMARIQKVLLLSPHIDRARFGKGSLEESVTTGIEVSG